MRSPSLRSYGWLLLASKECRELSASRAYWLLLLMIGPLVGHSFITAVDSYAEASGIGGGAAALSQGLTPLDGILVPTFGAYDLAVTLLFPFVAIRLIAAEKESGALKLLLQFPSRLVTSVAMKALVLLLGWLVAWLPGLFAMVLWKSYGGHLYAPETLNLLFGHLLRVILSASVAVAAAAIAESAASAAIATLGFTVGTWVLDFIGAGRGGWSQELAAYTPTAVLRVFEQGLLRSSTIVVIALLSLGGFALAAIWLRTGRSWRYRVLGSTVVVITLAVAVSVGASVIAPSTSWDVSENRRNSFSQTDEAALKRIKEPLRVTVYLSAEDPRLTDLERGILSKLMRLLPSVAVDYAASSRTGLFEGAEEHYGEVWYEMGGRKVMSRSTTEPIVLEQLYLLAGVQQPEQVEENDFPGYPLATRAKGAQWIFYMVFPLATILAFWLIRK